MKRKIILFIVAVSIISCSRKINEQRIIKNKIYESKNGPLYYGNRFILNTTDSSFIYVGQGPSVFLSKGTWCYNSTKDEIVFKSQPPAGKFVNPKTIDTLWLDLSNKRAKLKSKRRLIFDNILYHLQ